LPAHGPLAGIDTGRPNTARMYDYYLDGKDNYPADREAAEKVIAVAPHTPALARANRAFLHRAVRFMAGQAGIDQFLDIGCGLPTQGNVHQVAQSVRPDARVVYVDNDPVVLAHARALLATDGQTVAAEGDLRRPEPVLTDPKVTALIDFDRPVGLLFISVLHCVADDGELKEAIGRFHDALAPGSHVAISHITLPTAGPDQLDAARQGRQVYDDMRASTSMTFRDRDRLAALFEGLQLLEPGLVGLPNWRPEPADAEAEPVPLPDFFLCGVARKGDT
jgi:S-adenosyl methyltransferase